MPILRKPCLILDHDDTVVNSTAHIHYPAYRLAVSRLRPQVPLMDLNAYFEMNCDPGIFRYYTDVLGLDDTEMNEEFRLWKEYVKLHEPQVFPGMERVIRTQKQLGGVIAVVTHSEPEHVRRDWAVNGLPMPDLVFGGSVPEHQRKPSPWPVQEILRLTGMTPQDAVVVDDLSPGYQMAKAAGVDFAAAGWAHDIPAADGLFRREGQIRFTHPDELYAWLFA